MNRRHKPLRLNRSEGKVLGLCAGIADHCDMDVTLVRVGMALAILMSFPVGLIGYFILAAIADSGTAKRRAVRDDVEVSAARQRMRDMDARMQAIEQEIVHSNTALAREIDALR